MLVLLVVYAGYLLVATAWIHSREQARAWIWRTGGTVEELPNRERQAPWALRMLGEKSTHKIEIGDLETPGEDYSTEWLQMLFPELVAIQRSIAPRD